MLADVETIGQMASESSGCRMSQSEPISVIQRPGFSSFAEVIQVSEIIKTATPVNQPLCQVFDKHVYGSEW